MTGQIDTVLFDLDGTLVEYERPSSEVLEAAFEQVGAEPFFTVSEYYDRYFEFLGEDVSDLREHCFVTIALDSGRDPELARELAAAYASERASGGVRQLEGARTIVETLAEEYALGLVTNGPPEHQRPKIDAAGFGDLFDSIVFAGHETAAKPDPEPFERALRALDSTPDRAVYVGNSLDSDVAGAAAAGLRSVWVDDGSDPDPVPDHVVGSVAELRSPPWR